MNIFDIFDALEGFLISGGVYHAPPVSSQPEVTLSRWMLYEASFDDGTKSIHAVGWDGSGRASSAIQGEITKQGDNLAFTTHSGRRYELAGPPGFNSDAAYVWARWKTINKVTEERDVSNEHYVGQ